jgi:hypothetical protein
MDEVHASVGKGKWVGEREKGGKRGVGGEVGDQRARLGESDVVLLLSSRRRARSEPFT